MTGFNNVNTANQNAPYSRGHKYGDTIEFNTFSKLQQAGDGSRIFKVHIYYDKYVHGIEFEYLKTDGSGYRDGGWSTAAGAKNCQIIELAHDEYITSLSGRSGAWVDTITIETSAGQSHRCGSSNGGSAFEYKAATGTGICSVRGGCGGHLHFIAPYYAKLMTTPAPSTLLEPILGVANAKGIQGNRVKIPITVSNRNPDDAKLANIEISGVPSAYDIVVRTRSGDNQFRTANKGEEHAPGYYAWNVAPSKLADVSVQPKAGAISKPNGIFSLMVIAKVIRGNEFKSAMQILDVFIKPDAKSLSVSLNPIMPQYKHRSVKADGYVVKSAKLGLNGAVVFKVNAPSNTAIALKFLANDSLDSSKARFILNNRGNQTAAWKDPECSGSDAANDYDMLANCNNPGHGWREVPGDLRHISVNSFGRVWGTDSSNNIYIRNGTTIANTLGTGWSQVPADGFKLTSIGDRNQVWALGNNDKIFLRVGTSDTNPDGDSWKEIPGRLNWLSVGTLGQVWGVNDKAEVFRMTGISKERPQGSERWHKLDGLLNQISCHGKQVWGVNDNKNIYYRVGVSKSNPNGSTWKEVDGTGVRVEVSSDGRVWLVTHLNELWYRQGVSASNPGGLRWIKVDSDIKDVAVSGRCIWAIRASDEAILKRGHTERPTFWAQVDAGKARIGRGAKVGQEILAEYNHSSFDDVSQFALYSSSDEETKWDVSLPGKLSLSPQIINKSSGQPTKEIEVVGTQFDLSTTGFVKVDGGVLHATRMSGPQDGGCGFNIVILNKKTLAINEMKQYNVYNSESNCNDMANYLGYFDESYIICIYSFNAVKVNKKLSEAMKRCGASAAIDRITNWRHSYALIGVPGMGENSGREDLQLNDKKTTARVKANYTNGALTKSNLAALTIKGTKTSTKDTTTENGKWVSKTMIITGVPNNAMMSHGYAKRNGEDNEWTIPLSGGDVHLLYRADVVDEDGITAFNMRAAAGMSFDVGGASITMAAGVSSQNKAGAFSEEGNVWAGSISTTRLEVGASLITDDGNHALTIKGQKTKTVGDELSSGIGDKTRHGCWRCGGEGNLDGPKGTRKCPECDGNGYFISPGASAHIFAGSKLEMETSASYTVDIGSGARFNIKPSASVTVGCYQEGDVDLYAGEGRYGGQGGVSFKRGVDTNIEVESSIGSNENNIKGKVGVSPPGAVGIDGSALAKYNHGKITFGASGEVDVLFGGTNLEFECTIDTTPLQEFAVTLYDKHSDETSTAIVNGSVEALTWLEDAGHSIARRSDGAIAWTEGAAADTAEFLEDGRQRLANAGVVGEWSVGAADDVGDWSVNAANDVAGWTSTAAIDVADWTETAASDVGTTVSSVVKSIAEPLSTWICTGMLGKGLITENEHAEFEGFARWVLQKHTSEIMMYWKVLEEPVRIAVSRKDDDWWNTHLEWSNFCLEMIAEGSDESLEAVYLAFLHKGVQFVEQFTPELNGVAPYHQDLYYKVKELVTSNDCPYDSLLV